MSVFCDTPKNVKRNYPTSHMNVFGWMMGDLFLEINIHMKSHDRRHVKVGTDHIRKTSQEDELKKRKRNLTQALVLYSFWVSCPPEFHHLAFSDVSLSPAPHHLSSSTHRCKTFCLFTRGNTLPACLTLPARSSKSLPWSDYPLFPRFLPLSQTLLWTAACPCWCRSRRALWWETPVLARHTEARREIKPPLVFFFPSAAASTFNQCSETNYMAVVPTLLHIILTCMHFMLILVFCICSQ